MKSWIIQPPTFVRRLFANSLWRLSEGGKRLALTFDDGPVPEHTIWILDTLDKYGVKATFFCVGDNVRKYPALFDEIVRRGHTIGNHTYNHLQLFKTPWGEYKKNIEKCSLTEGGCAKYFRAPHGQMLPWRTGEIAKSMSLNKVVFWDVMPKDYDKSLTPEEVYKNIRDYVRDGSLIVLHDSIKSGDRMRYALEHTLEDYSREGWQFVSL